MPCNAAAHRPRSLAHRFAACLAAAASVLALAATTSAARARADRPLPRAGDTAAAASHRAAEEVAQRGAIPRRDRSKVLGEHYETSDDQLWTLTSGPRGVGVMRGDVAAGGAWSPVATLAVAGTDSRQWIGQACRITGTSTLAVAYGPVEYLRLARMFERGAFAALVDLETGAVRALPLRPTFSYFSPTCGSDATASFTSFGREEETTSVTAVDRRGRIVQRADGLRGEFVHATRTARHAMVAIDGHDIVRLGDGHAARIAHTDAVVTDVAEDEHGDVVYVADRGEGATVERLTAGRPVRLAAVARGQVEIHTVDGRRVVAQGHGIRRAGPAASLIVSTADAAASPSRNGSLFVSSRGVADASSGMSIKVVGAHGDAATVNLPARLTAATGERVAASARSARTAAVAASSATTTDANLPCAVPRNDVATQAYQPSADQVEWTVDRAVAGTLTQSRAANYRHYGLPAYSAQGLAPLRALTGGGSVPPQVMFGILANESNLWQASSHVEEGNYGNPLTGNIYGRSGEELAIDFGKADCGYGIAQVTDGMRKGNQSATTQRAIALDYQVNIAAGLNILISKWNQLRSYSPAIVMNDGSPKWLENWYAAAWAYNSGLQPNAAEGNTTNCVPGPNCTDAGGRWGLGWANNPSNPIYPANRHMFNVDPQDATHPSRWPYQERVIGWAAYPIYKPGGTYSQAYWLSDANRLEAVPNPALFCTSANLCDTSKTGADPLPCTRSDRHCWIHYPVSWKRCTTDASCGYPTVGYSSGAAEPADPSFRDKADCDRSALPSSAVIVDDRPSSSPSPYASCSSITTAGSFAFSFPADANGNYPSHIDLHQISGGLNGHYWFQHATGQEDLTTATGTWSFPSTTTGWGRVMVHVPALGAQTKQARYQLVDGATGARTTRVLNQNWGSNHWYSLGAAQFTANEKLVLSSYSTGGNGDDLAWDAVAFVPTAKPTYRVVALGDSYAAGEGLEPYQNNADTSSDACHRSDQGYPNLITLPGSSTPLAKDSTNQLINNTCAFATMPAVSFGGASASGEEVPAFSNWGGAYYQWGEELQAEAGYLDSGTDAVTLTIGGNDVRFSPVLQLCSAPNASCANDDIRFGDRAGNKDPAPLHDYEPHIITDLLPTHLQRVIADVRAKAPNAHIFVVGYPLLFPRGGGGCGANSTINAGNQEWINQMTDLLSTAQSKAVSAAASSGTKVHYVDPRQAFAGHDACGSSPWLNAVINYSDDAMGRHFPGTGSYHPNATGQKQLAALVTQSMKTYLPAR